MGYTQLTLNANNFSTNQDIDAGTFANVVDGNGSTNIEIGHGGADFPITHTFDTPQFLNKIAIQWDSIRYGEDYLVQVSIDGINFTTISGGNVTGNSSHALLEYPFTQPYTNPQKYKAFRFFITDEANILNVKIRKIKAYIPDDIQSGKYSVRDYNVEFDDSLLDMASWNNARYDGCKISGSRINVFTEGDPIYPYGLKPIIENKTCAIFVGNNVQDGEVTSSLDPLVEIHNHSYVTIDTILLVDLQTLKSTKITHEQFNETENKKESFRRLIADNFPEGSKIVTKLLDIATAAQLKESHHVKFNQGLLMKLYSYTANTDGKEDGVFGGFGIRDEKGILIDNVASGGGLFGFGTTVATSASLFGLSNGGPTTFTAYTTIDEFPSELSLYGNIGQITHLSPATASGAPISNQSSYTRRIIQ